MAEEKLSDPVEYLKKTKEKCPDVVYIFTTRQAKLLSQTGNEPYDPKDVNQEFLSDYNAWASMKQRVDQSRQSLRRDMLTPHNLNEPIAAEDFLKQTEVLNEVCNMPSVCAVGRENTLGFWRQSKGLAM